MAAQSESDALWVPEWVAAEGERTIAKRSHAKGAEIKFYGSWFCPFVQRVWIALEELKFDYQYVEINPYEVDPKEPGGYTKRQLPLATKKEKYPDFIAASPRGLVPALVHEKECVWESLPMLEYLSEISASRGGPSLMPDDAIARAHIRIWTDFFGNQVQKAFYTVLMEQDPAGQDAVKSKFFDACVQLAGAMGSGEDGPFFLGKQFSLFDAACAPFYQRFLWIGAKYRDLQFPKTAPFQRLNQWWNAVSARPSVAATMVCKARLQSSYSQYARNLGTSDYAQSVQSSLSASARAKQQDYTQGSISESASGISIAQGAGVILCVAAIAGLVVQSRGKK